jgi:hypothetical protein
MRLSALLPELREFGIGIAAKYENAAGKKGIDLGDPLKGFPQVQGPRYPIDVTDESDPDISETEVRRIRHRFGIRKA